MAQLRPAPGGPERRAAPDERQRVLRRVRRRQLGQPSPGAVLPAGLDHPFCVPLLERPQADAVALQHRVVDPAAPGLARVIGQQGPHPGVTELAPVRQPLAQRALEREAELPRHPARGPVADVGQPDHRGQVLLPEAPLEQHPEGVLHVPGAAHPGVRAVGDLGAPVALVAQHDVAGVPALRLHHEAPLLVGLPAARDVAEHVVAGVVHRVRDRHGRPLLRQRVLALLPAAEYVASPPGGAG